MKSEGGVNLQACSSTSHTCEPGAAAARELAARTAVQLLPLLQSQQQVHLGSVARSHRVACAPGCSRGYIRHCTVQLSLLLYSRACHGCIKSTSNMCLLVLSHLLYYASCCATGSPHAMPHDTLYAHASCCAHASCYAHATCCATCHMPRHLICYAAIYLLTCHLHTSSYAIYTSYATCHANYHLLCHLHVCVQEEDRDEEVNRRLQQAQTKALIREFVEAREVQRRKAVQEEEEQHRKRQVCGGGVVGMGSLCGHGGGRGTGGSRRQDC